ncbi:MAG: hypothetical protein MUC55_07410, partial [Burkholderiales bacterium]|nr:hypothetical protein [Burkholderiales bacterium]
MKQVKPPMTNSEAGKQPKKLMPYTLLEKHEHAHGDVLRGRLSAFATLDDAEYADARRGPCHARRLERYRGRRTFLRRSGTIALTVAE